MAINNVGVWWKMMPKCNMSRNAQIRYNGVTPAQYVLDSVYIPGPPFTNMV